MRNSPLRAFAKKSPVRSALETAGEVAKETGKQVTKEAIKKGVKKVAGRTAGMLASGAGAALGLGGAAYGIVEGYGDLAKTEHGSQIIKDARMMPGKM